jgi:AcrR family transcriptional regulator
MRTSTKIEKRPRGRPRLFNEEEVLNRVRAVFLAKGFSGASLDELAEAAEVNRPSLYAAFGDKEQLYLRTLRRYGEQSVAVMDAIFAREQPLAERLAKVYRAAITLYTAAPKATGCMIINTAVVEAPTHPKIAREASAMLAAIEGSFVRAFIRAVADREISASPSPTARARLASGVFDILAVRARLGAGVAELRAFAQSMVPAICADARGSSA